MSVTLKEYKTQSHIFYIKKMIPFDKAVFLSSAMLIVVITITESSHISQLIDQFVSMTDRKIRRAFETENIAFKQKDMENYRILSLSRPLSLSHTHAHAHTQKAPVFGCYKGSSCTSIFHRKNYNYQKW